MQQLVALAPSHYYFSVKLLFTTLKNLNKMGKIRNRTMGHHWLISMVVVFLAALIPHQSTADEYYTYYYDFMADGIAYNIIDNQTVSVTYECLNYYYSYYGDDWPYEEECSNEYAYYNLCGDVVIPSTVKRGSTTYTVVGIDSQAFYGCEGITSITIPNSVTTIGESAFEGTAWYNNQPDGLVYAGLVAYTYKGAMPNGTSIAINNGTKSITGSCFSGCSGLTSITIPNSVTSIGNSAFSGCSGLTSVDIPNSVTTIGSYAFSGCNGLTDIVVASGNPNYDSRGNCNAIIKTATNTLVAGCKNTVIPNSVTSINEYAFSGCSGLTSITIPNSVTSIGQNAFQGCSGLTSLTIPNSVTSIGASAFKECSNASSG